ncbi:MAG: flavin-containing monooxygenase, partial [Gammaproteobacteria bacterium]
EILEYCQAIATRYKFYEKCLFHTTVEQTVWNEDEQRWHVHTDRGDVMRARYVVLANGILTSPRLARIDGMETFKGDSFHTSRWNYHVNLESKRVGIIGTGATAIQAVPELAKVVGELYVFQRTPSSVDIRNQRATTPEEIEQWKQEPGWALARRNRLATINSGRSALLGDDAYLSGKISDYKPKKQHAKKLSPEELVQKQLNTSFRIMEQIRSRVDAVVDDPQTAASLKPYYPYGCKRPTFHDEFLPTFNLPHVTLVDTAPRGVQKINERGVVHDGKQYELDVLIYATGFQWMGTGAFNMIVGKDGQTLRDKWATEGTKTFLGIHHHGFPNLFIMSGPQGGGGQFNFMRGLESHTDYITWMLTTMRERGAQIVEIKRQPELDYAEHCKQVDILTSPLRDCLSYYNSDGAAEPGSLAYYGGPAKWHALRAEAQESMAPYIFDGKE